MTAKSQQAQRISGFDQLGDYKADIVVSQKNPQASNSQEGFRNQPRKPRVDNKPPRFQPQHESVIPYPVYMTPNGPAVLVPQSQMPKAVAPTIQARQGQPSLEEFIMELQGHRFSFTFRNPNQLKYFVAAQSKEFRFHKIAWTGGDEYMLALMLYMKKAVDYKPPVKQKEAAAIMPVVNPEMGETAVTEAADSKQPAVEENSVSNADTQEKVSSEEQQDATAASV